MKNKLKICGIRTPDTAVLAAASAAHYLGLILVPGSPRCVTADEAAAVADAARATNPAIRIVAVVMDWSPADIRSAVAPFHPEVIQLHGHEEAGVARALRPDFEIWKRFYPDTDINYPADALLVDSPRPGSGQPGNWTAAAALVRAGKRTVLAGGLGCHNLAEAAKVGAEILDLNSTLEDRPGHKCREKMLELFNTYRSIAK